MVRKRPKRSGNASAIEPDAWGGCVSPKSDRVACEVASGRSALDLKRESLCSAFARDELADCRHEFRGHNHQRLVVLAEGGFNLGGLFVFRLTFVSSGKFANTFLGPTRRQALLLHRFFL